MRAVMSGILIIVLDPKNGIERYGPAILPIQVLIFKIPLFLFFFILFKMKKIEILLDYSQDENEATQRASMVLLADRLKKFVYMSRIFLFLYVLNIVVLFVVMLLFAFDGMRNSVSRLALQVLAIIVAVNQVFLFAHFTLMIVYFYRMGLRYIRLLQIDDESINFKKSTAIMILMTAILFLTSINLFLVLGFFFINNTFDLHGLDNRYSWFNIIQVILQIIELYAPLPIGLFMLFIITFFSKMTT